MDVKGSTNSQNFNNLCIIDSALRAKNRTSAVEESVDDLLFRVRGKRGDVFDDVGECSLHICGKDTTGEGVAHTLGQIDDTNRRIIVAHKGEEGEELRSRDCTKSFILGLLSKRFSLGRG